MVEGREVHLVCDGCIDCEFSRVVVGALDAGLVHFCDGVEGFLFDLRVCGGGWDDCHSASAREVEVVVARGV